jgi:transposase
MRKKIRPEPGPLYVGVDISKDTLDCHAPGLELNLPNTREGCAQLITAARAVKRRVHFVCESTGIYSRCLVGYLHARRCKVSVIPAMRVRQFARATCRVAKTDKIDAMLLSVLGRTLRPMPTEKIPPVIGRLRQIVRWRRGLQCLMTLQSNRRLTVALPMLKRSSDNLQDTIKAEIVALDAEALRIVSTNQRLRALHRTFCDVCGIGSLSAIYILAECPEIGRLNRQQVGALAGLAPYARDSGSVNGARHIYGGRKHLRSGIFMSALVATRYNPVLATFYNRLRDAGKPGHVALIAVARKLLIHLNTLAARERTTF